MKLVQTFVMVLVMTMPAFAQQSGWIGVSVVDQPDRGVLVRSVDANSPAEKAGLKADDIILEYNKQQVVGVLQLQRLVSETPAGRGVDVTVSRNNREQTLKITTETSPMVIGPFHIPKPDLTTVRERLNTVPQLEALVGVLGPPTGLRADPLTPQLREFFGVKTNEGVLVSSVDANSPASKAGLMAGDVIIAVDGTTISTPQEFNREVRSRNAAFTLKVVRNKQEREIRVERQREFGPGTQF